VRILHLSSLYPPHIVGGAERSVEHLAEELASMGHDVGAACIAREAVAKELRHGVTVYRMAHSNDFWLEDWVPHTRFERAWQKMKQQWNTRIETDFAEVLEDFKPDILNTHSLVDISTLVWRAAKQRNIPIVHTICEYDLICANAAMFRHGKPCAEWHLNCRAINLSKLFTNRWIDAVASVGTAILRTHVDLGYFTHLPPSRRKVIYYSCTVPGGDPAQRRKINRSGQPLKFGYLGRINVEKGVGTMIQAFSRLKSKNWKCVIAGRSMDDIQDRFKSLSQGLPIEFVGWADPKAFFMDIDVLIVPSFWAEPSPRTIYESYMMGVPVIGARSGGIPELIGDSNDDWLFEPGNDADLAIKIAKVIESGRDTLPDESSFKHVIDESTAPRVAEKYLALYEELLA
jgi:glycosyltransferase involved in cell wall biosynthesis